MYTVSEIQNVFPEIRDVEGVLRRADFWPRERNENGEALFDHEAARFIADLFHQLEDERNLYKRDVALRAFDEAVNEVRHRFSTHAQPDANGRRFAL